MSVYCEDCEFSEMEMAFVNDDRWFQRWWCKNFRFATRSNAVNKPFVGKVLCKEQNKGNDCQGFKQKPTGLAAIFKFFRSRDSIPAWIILGVVFVCLIGLFVL